MLLSAVSVLVVAQSSSEIPEGLMNNPVFLGTEQRSDATAFRPLTSSHYHFSSSLSSFIKHTSPDMAEFSCLSLCRLTNNAGSLSQSNVVLCLASCLVIYITFLDWAKRTNATCWSPFYNFCFSSPTWSTMPISHDFIVPFIALSISFRTPPLESAS